MSDPVTDILEHGSDTQRAALRSFAAALTDAAAAAAAPAESLPGLGEPPTADEVAGAVHRNHERLWRFREQLYDSALPYREAARRLGVSTNQITNLVRAGDLLALDGRDGPRLPSWQFNPDTRRGRLEGIGHVTAVFPGRVLGLSAWMTTLNQALDGRTAADALANGDVDRVVALAAYK
jgi:hypothetical protein